MGTEVSVFVITVKCDPYYDEFEGHVFSTREKAEEYIRNNADGWNNKDIVEVIVD